MSFGSSKPPPIIETPPPPEETDEEIIARVNKEKERLRKMAGRKSTMLTGGVFGEAPTEKKSLLTTLGA